MTSDSVLLQIENGVATVTLNQPEVRNALTPELRTSFREIIASLEFNNDARCIVITGAGDHFMSGGDIRSMVTFLNPLQKTCAIEDSSKINWQFKFIF